MKIIIFNVLAAVWISFTLGRNYGLSIDKTQNFYNYDTTSTFMLIFFLVLNLLVILITLYKKD